MRLVRYAWIAALLTLGAVCARAGDDFPPVKPFELAMQKDASNPSQAEILYHESTTNNQKHYTSEYYRIKIFTEAGKKYGDIVVRYSRDLFQISDVKGRTVCPDGSITPFDGKLFDKVVAKHRGIEIRATVFTLPNVQAGCILEYRYRLNWDLRFWVMPRWIVQEELPTLEAEFFMNIPHGVSLAPIAVLPLRYNWSSGPGSLSLELNNIPPFEHEESSLPDEALKMHVLFYSMPEHFTSEADFWKESGKTLYKSQGSFTEPRKGVMREQAQLVQPADPPEAKLRKLYARAQQIRNLSYEAGRTEAEEKREKRKDSDNADQVLEHGYGYRNQINATFVALARAAGFPAGLVYVSERYEMPFDSTVLDLDQVPWALAVVTLGNEERFFDPGTPGCPFGLIPGEDIKVQGVRPTQDGVQFVTTPLPSPQASQRIRKADLTIAEDGSLHGRLSVTYTGLHALDERLYALRKDDSERRRQIEEEIRNWLPSESQVKLEKVSGWDDVEQPLQVEATLDVPNMSTAAGSRVILPSDILEVNHQNPFDHASRKWDIYLDYPRSTTDDLTLHLTAGWQVEALPPSRELGGGVRLHYQVSRTQAGADVHIQRQFRLADIFFEHDFYPALRQFYSNVVASDGDLIVLRPGAPAK